MLGSRAVVEIRVSNKRMRCIAVVLKLVVHESHDKFQLQILVRYRIMNALQKTTDQAGASFSTNKLVSPVNG